MARLLRRKRGADAVPGPDAAVDGDAVGGADPRPDEPASESPDPVGTGDPTGTADPPDTGDTDTRIEPVDDLPALPVGEESGWFREPSAPRRRRLRRRGRAELAATAAGRTTESADEEELPGAGPATRRRRFGRRRTAAAGSSETTADDAAVEGGGAVATLERDPADTDQAAGTADGTADGTAEGTTRPGRLRRLGRRVRASEPVLLARAAHPKQAVLTALVLGGCALLAGRPLREAGVVTATVLVGQAMLGWHNDLVDRVRDARHRTPGKPVADGRLEPGSVWFALVIGVLLVVPLAVATGVTAGTAYLLSLVVGGLGNVLLREGLFSWAPWAVSFALYPAYLAYGGWGGTAEGDPPQVAMTVLAALLGIGVHVVRSIWGLVADDADGWRYLPLRFGRRLGATRLLLVGGTWCVLVVAAIVVVGVTTGLRQ